MKRRRRYKRVKKGEVPLPDVLFVDGGKGQMAEALTVLDELELDWLQVIAVAKGRARRPGTEQLFLAGQTTPTILPGDSPALHLIQQIRDEAHRFAITGHRQRRAKARRTSRLEEIPGLGPKRRRELLKQFGGSARQRGAQGTGRLVERRRQEHVGASSGGGRRTVWTRRWRNAAFRRHGRFLVEQRRRRYRGTASAARFLVR